MRGLSKVLSVDSGGSIQVPARDLFPGGGGSRC